MSADDRLDSWKEIAAYLRRGARTVQRWEAEEGLPVHRLQHEKLGSVYAFRSELDAWWQARRASLENASPISEPAAPSIAVLPFADLSPDRAQAYFCEGIADEILMSLSRIDGLRVSSRGAAFRYRVGIDDPREFARRLRVSRLLEGSVRRAGASVRISVQLTDPATGYQVWSASYDRELSDIFALQEEIAREVARAMALTLGTSVAPTSDPQAYDCYLRGRKFYYGYGPRDLEFARQLFAKAAGIDPGFALAWAGIADCWSYTYLNSRRRPEYVAQACEAAERAVALRPESAQAHASRALAWSLREGGEQVDREFATALKLDPNLFEAHYFLARHLFAAGRQEEAVRSYEEAMRVRPEDYQAPLLVAQSYEDLGRPEVARHVRLHGIEMAEAHLAFYPDDTRAMYMAANGMVALGQVKRGLEWAERARSLRPDDGMLLYNLGCIYAMANRPEEALSCLGHAAALGFVPGAWLERDSNLDSLRGLPEFRALLSSLLP